MYIMSKCGQSTINSIAILFVCRSESPYAHMCMHTHIYASSVSTVAFEMTDKDMPIYVVKEMKAHLEKAP